MTETPAPELVEVIAAALARCDGLDWDETCGREIPDGDECDSGTCVAAHWEDHDAEYARRWYMHRARAALAAMPATDADAGLVEPWQPIETAPKDGAAVIVIDMGALVPEAGMAWFVNDTWVGDDPGIDRGEEWRRSTWPSPTHWMPLPDGPKAALGQGGVR